MNPPAETLIKKGSKIEGDGIVTLFDIPVGAFVLEFKGQTYKMLAMYLRILLQKERNLDDPLQIGHRTFMSLDLFSRTINHSCDPNCGVVNGIELRAIKHIKANEEITYDYSTTVSPELYWWSMECQCGAERCRKVIGPADSLPYEVWKEYKMLGVLPEYVERKQTIFLLSGLLRVIQAPARFLLYPFRNK